MYVFYSANECATNAEKGFWNDSNKSWDVLDHATQYFFTETLNMSLPIAVGDDARVVAYSEAIKHYGTHDAYYLLNPPH